MKSIVFGSLLLNLVYFTQVEDQLAALGPDREIASTESLNHQHSVGGA